MAWNYMQVELVAEDLQARPIIGPGGLTRQQAIAEVQSLLDRAARVSPLFEQPAATWRRGNVKNDTVYAGPFVWTVYEHPDGDDPRRAALDWLDNYAQILRRAGMDVQVAQLPC